MTPSTEKQKLNRYDKILILLFVVSLPLVNPWVRGDGVGYYAYARAIVVNHNLRFEQDWLRANTSFYMGRVDAPGHLRADQYTPTGHLDNHFSIGPALIWIPFLEIAHLAVLGADRLGARIPADGFSWPYIDTMAIVTALAGFLGLFLSFRLARKYFPERWAFLATLGIWLASSLIVYMYFNPSWSHAHSAFVVALFLWVPKKSPDLLLDAYALWRRDTHDATNSVLVLAGPEERNGYAARLKSLAAASAIGNHVLFTGPLYDDAKWAAYRDADVFVLPSRNENFGNSAAEAMACGTPVIVTDQCGIAPIIGGLTGLVVPHDSNAVATALKMLLENNGLAAQFRGACPGVVRGLSWEQPLTEMEAVYRNAVAEAA